MAGFFALDPWEWLHRSGTHSGRHEQHQPSGGGVGLGGLWLGRQCHSVFALQTRGVRTATHMLRCWCWDRECVSVCVFLRAVFDCRGPFAITCCRRVFALCFIVAVRSPSSRCGCVMSLRGFDFGTPAASHCMPRVWRSAMHFTMPVGPWKPWFLLSCHFCRMLIPRDATVRLQ